jgi:hypothetical protein
MLQCRFCHVTEKSKASDGYLFDFYECEECISIVCYMCVETSVKTGKDYCQFCKRNLQYNGEWK